MPRFGGDPPRERGDVAPFEFGVVVAEESKPDALVEALVEKMPAADPAPRKHQPNFEDDDGEMLSMKDIQVVPEAKKAEQRESGRYASSTPPPPAAGLLRTLPPTRMDAPPPPTILLEDGTPVTPKTSTPPEKVDEKASAESTKSKASSRTGRASESTQSGATELTLASKKTHARASSSRAVVRIARSARALPGMP